MTLGAITLGAIDAGNWDGVAYNAGTLAGGFAAGGSGGGRWMANRRSLGGPSSVPKSKNPFTADNDFGFVRNPELSLRADVIGWLGTGPTPTSGGTTAALISSGVLSTLSPYRSDK